MSENESLDIKFSKDDIDWIFSPQAIREQSQKIFDMMSNGPGKTHFLLHMDKLPQAAERVLKMTKNRFPDLNVPAHSRWGHFTVGEKDRVAELLKTWGDLDREELGRRLFDLVVVSVLLDAGAGKTWSFKEQNDEYARSEGLAVASFHMFVNGDFSSNPDNPFQVDAQGLKNLTVDQLRKGFQVGESNELVGIEGRVTLLQSLGNVISQKKNVFCNERLSGILDYWKEEFIEGMSGSTLLREVLAHLGAIWPSRLKLGRNHLGDVWHYPLFEPKNSIKSLVPFHKLSQWLSYSLSYPIESYGIKLDKMEALTGLPEYRNGGLFLDAGVLEVADKDLLKMEFAPDHPLIIEWRAATIILLDKVAAWMRQELKLSEIDLPLGSVLEGGSWWAGREIAKELRADGSPPLNIKSDGTVF